MGNCLAGDTCIFSHDPSHFVSRLALEESSTPPLQALNHPSNFKTTMRSLLCSLSRISGRTPSHPLMPSAIIKVLHLPLLLDLKACKATQVMALVKERDLVADINLESPLRLP